jgi:predicted nucleic acid-binding Zn ribbon protein
MYNDKRLRQLWLNVQRPLRYQPLGELVAPIRDKFSTTRNTHLAKIGNIWHELVGPDLADLCFPFALQSDILIVSVASPAVKFTIEQIYRQSLLDQVREQTGKRLNGIKCILNSGQPN